MQEQTTDRLAPKSSDRGSQIANAASVLFRRRGFDNVSMRDVAETVGVTAPAIYRHFPSKQAMLSASITSGLESVEAVLVRARDLPLEELLQGLAGVAVDRRDLWLLIVRESEHLPEKERRDVQHRFARLGQEVGERIVKARPTLGEDDVALLARAVLAGLAAPAQFPLRVGQRKLESCLAQVAVELCDLEIPTSLRQAILPPSASPFDSGLSRREELLSVAAQLFGERGYRDVSLSDIGAAADMAGPSLYHHFASKSEILLGVMRRSIDWIELDRLRALREHKDPATALRHLVDAYVAMATDTPALFQVFTKEGIHLPAEDRAMVNRATQDLVTHWAALVARVDPGASPAEVRVRVTACLCIVNDVAPSRRLAAQPGFAARLSYAASTVLGLTAPGRDR